MDPTTGVLLVAGAFNLLLTAVILLQAPKTRANLAYAALVGALLLWIGAIVVLRLTPLPHLQFVALATSYLAGTAIAVTFWYFVAFFAGRLIPRGHHLAVLGGAITVVALAYLSPAFIEGIERLPTGDLSLHLGPAHAVFATYFALVMAAAFVRLYRRYRESAPAARSSLGLVFLGTLLTALIGSTFNIALVAFGNAQFIGWGPVATIIMVSFLAVAIIRHHLMSIHLIGAEVFTLALLLILFVQFVFQPGTLGRVVSGVTLALATGFGLLLTRSALEEAESRDRLAQANEELRRLDTAKSEFISLASHQLRTPVTVVRGYASEIKGGSLGPVSIRMAEGLDRLLAAASQLSRLVDDLLDLSRIETGRMHYEFKLVRLEEVVQTVLRELEIRAKQKGISLRFQDRNATALLAVADSQKIQEVVTNLVDNAIAYSSKGTVDIELRPGEIQAAPTLVLSVTDAGLGIGTKDLPRLFTKFERTMEAKAARPDGMGLGLYLVKKVIEDHAGRVGVESAGLGKGSTFWVEVPAQSLSHR